MATQMYIVAFKGAFSQEVSRSVQHCVRQHGGLILMVVRTGVIVALDDSQAPMVQSHPDVALVGGVTLNPRGYAAERLQRIFAENLSKQLEIKTE
ncbi:MAG TPA: hypothetical protein VJV74_06495 [Terriglobia bacterium]|nr:hypothetical protein [Terriglobia bacterium]